MALIQDIIQQLQQLGLNVSGYSDISTLNPEQIAGGLQSTYNLTGQDLPAGLFQSISPELLAGGLGKTYAPQMEAGGQSLLGNLRQQYSSQGSKAFGGFAGSGQQQAFTQSAKDVYGKGMTDVLAQTGQQRLSGLQNVQDIINQWRQSALDISG